MKYKLTKTTKEFLGRTLFQIQATSDFGNVSKGDLGGFIEKEDNLSQKDNAWVSGNAQVFGNAWVYGSARVYGEAEKTIKGYAVVWDKTKGLSWDNIDQLLENRDEAEGCADIDNDEEAQENTPLIGVLPVLITILNPRTKNGKRKTTK